MNFLAPLTRASVALTGAIILAASSSLPASQQREMQKLAVISGTVVGADTNAPMRRAQVTVSSESLKLYRAVDTDDFGRFTIPELPRGRIHSSGIQAGLFDEQFWTADARLHVAGCGD